MIITKEFTFDAAHFIPNYHGKCEKLHGHTYKLQVSIEGDVNEHGMVLDFAELKKIVKEHVIHKLDHTSLNDTIENPSAENTAIWIWAQLKNIQGAKLYEVKLWETPTSFVTYHGE
jgi:6-pyruvoyltetrahydropterin/6-carboxytetrahydropterin synthase